MSTQNTTLPTAYDKTVVRKHLGETIKYGIVYGNEKIVFIKVGAGGNIKGYKNKYLKMTNRIHQRMGATVICASSPDCDDTLVDKSVILETASALGCNSFTLYLFGTSEGAYKNLLLAAQIPQTIKLLSVNSSFISEDKFIEKLGTLPQLKKILVYGTNDYDYQIVPQLKAANCDNLEIITVNGADHNFTGMTEQYIELIDLM